MKNTIALFLALFLSNMVLAQQNSVLNEGNFYKLAVSKNGIYKIDRSFLVKMGINPDQINPQNIRIFGNGGGILPQENATNRTADLLENAIWVEGEQDGKFDATDFVLFYGQSADRFYIQANQIRREANPYENQNYYFLEISTKKGKRISEQKSLTGGTSFSSFDDFIFHETNKKNIIDSGREWYGELFDLQPKQNFEYDVEGIVPNSPLFLRTNVLAVGEVITFFNFKINDQAIGSVRLGALPTGTYDPKGVIGEAIFEAKASADPKMKLQIEYDKRNSAISFGHLNFFELNFQRKLKLYNGQTTFRVFESARQSISRFVVEGNEKMQIWDISNVQNIAKQESSFQNNQAIFSLATANVLKEFVVFDGTNFFEPVFLKKIANQNLRAVQTPDLLIVCNATFLEQAQRLADFRKKNDGLSVAVVTTEQIYNEFSSGKKDLTAIRDFTKFLYDQSKKLNYLLLFGDASYDYLEIQNPNAHYIVPTYESRESLHPVSSYCSDDYFGFLEQNEGKWGEEAGEKDQEHSLDVGVGRLPVRTLADAKNIVDKLIAYTQAPALGAWRNKLTFVADDGDFNIHLQDAEDVINQIEFSQKNYNFDKLYIDAFARQLESGGLRSPIVREKVIEKIENGTLIMSYIGHGSERAWAEEEVLSLATIEKLNNPKNLPIMLTATCEFGRFDNDPSQSGAEKALTNPNGGAVALLTSTRPAYSFTNLLLGKAFFKYVFEAKTQRLGDIIRKTKNQSIDGIANRNFALLGDPSMVLAYPKGTIKLTSVKDQNGQENRLSAMSKITIIGEVHDSQLINTFNGQLDILIYDKKSEKLTLGIGTNSIPARFEEYENVIFRGKASVRNGRFSFSFVVPKDINYKDGFGKISLYAHDSIQNIDAHGFDEIPTGGTAANIQNDNTPPKIKLGMDKTDFVSGGTVKPNTTLLATISDENGISYTGAGIGHDIEAVLDGQTRIILNTYFQANIDDYTNGNLSYAFKNLAEGKHQIRLKAWDTFNNSSEAEVEFFVRKEAFSVQLSNYPNPFSQKTGIVFTHNRPNEHLYIDVEIYASNGQLVRTLHSESFNSLSRIDQLSWDGKNEWGTYQSNGLYIYKIRLRTDSNETAQSASKMLLIR